MALALPVFRIDMLAKVLSTSDASSLSDILRAAIISSNFIIILIIFSFPFPGGEPFYIVSFWSSDNSLPTAKISPMNKITMPIRIRK